MIRLLIISCFAVVLTFAHGVSHFVSSGEAIIVSANFAANAPAAYAKITIFEGDSAIALIKSQMDANGKFAFVPQNQGKYRVQIAALSDHGEHKSEFEINIDENFKLANYEEPLYAKYGAFLGAAGILFGVFGVLAMFKSRQKA